MKDSRPNFNSDDKDKSPADGSVKDGGYELKGRVWIEGPSGTFLGYGRAVLLERIREYGSISEAARSMGMSYRHAWELVDSMNREAKAPLVETATGGKGGGGARLTSDGEAAIESFWGLHARFKEFLKNEMENLII
ncbi:MAG: LysR family transcriptional regulator [Desulfobacteraceae bacterium]|nr:LysR family transcriptional regulator [Desulfobacteraceae bacterium]